MAIMPEVRDPRTSKTLNRSQVFRHTLREAATVLAAREPLPIGPGCGIRIDADTGEVDGDPTAPIGLVGSIETSDSQLVDQELNRNIRKRRAVLLTARLMEKYEQLLDPGHEHYFAMITLTFANVETWHPRAITRTVKCTRDWLARRDHPMIYLAVPELGTRTKRLHYHMLVMLRHGTKLPKPDRQGWWKHGATRIERVRKNAAGYLAKYLAKPQDMAALPKGMRAFMSGGLNEKARRERRWERLPPKVRRDCTPDDDVRAARGGGHTSRTTGRHWPSEWVYDGTVRLRGKTFTRLITREAWHQRVAAYHVMLRTAAQRWTNAPHPLFMEAPK